MNILTTLTRVALVAIVFLCSFASGFSQVLGTAANSNVIIRQNSGSTSNYFINNLWLFRGGQGSDWYTARLHDGISIDNSFTTPRVNTRTWWERDPANNIQSWGNDNTAYFTIYQGKIGVGTTAPMQPLTVVGTNNDENPSIPKVLTVSDPSSLNKSISLGYSPTLDAGVIASVNRGNGWRNTLINPYGGAVCIGTTNPGSFHLAVNGKIGAREVNVTSQNPFPDYVFENTYNLRPLSQVESFIKENKHLPEIPSAKEVEASGINLGEMEALLLKKIEELTLYTIEINKKMEVLETENRKLNQEIEQLKTN
jgi:hypothetical protein